MTKLGKEGTKWSFLSLFKSLNDKNCYNVISPNVKRTKNGKGKENSGSGCAGAFFLKRERISL